MLLLGPIPEAVRLVVRRLVAEARPQQPHADERLNGFVLYAAPGAAYYIDADGEVWHLSFWWNPAEDIVEHVPDGPRKVGLIAIAAEGVPELAAWLPERPADAIECVTCKGSGNLPPPIRFQCPKCCGLGWVS